MEVCFYEEETVKLVLQRPRLGNLLQMGLRSIFARDQQVTE
jgi:hypothetical protein